MVYVKDVTQGSVSWAVFMFSWPYFSIPIAFAIDEKLRARWLLQDVSRPATGYRFKGTNLQMVFTSRAARVKGASLDSAEDEGERQSRRLDCTNLWPLSVIIPAVFVCAAEGTSGAASVLFVCTPFLFLVVFSLTLSQVSVCVRFSRKVDVRSVDIPILRYVFKRFLHSNCFWFYSALEKFVVYCVHRRNSSRLC